MAMLFKVLDVLHTIMAWFIPASLPTAKKKYHLATKSLAEIDVHGIAGKAAVYNIPTDPEVIERGLNDGLALIYYLVADGYTVKTPLFTLKIGLPGEYAGDETALPEGLYPEGRITLSRRFKEYLKKTVTVTFLGALKDHGHIAEALDEADGSLDETATIGDYLTLRGHGLKVGGDAAHSAETGVFFEPEQGGPRIRAKIARNERHTVKLLVPPGLTLGGRYRLVIVTQTTVGQGGCFLKNLRTVTSDFTVTIAPSPPPSPALPARPAVPPAAGDTPKPPRA